MFDIKSCIGDRRSGRAALVTAAALGLSQFICGSPAIAAAPCRILELASLPASFKDGELLIDVGINGETVKFRLGTYSAFT
jgi:hypothetical protein